MNDGAPQEALPSSPQPPNNQQTDTTTQGNNYTDNVNESQPPSTQNVPQTELKQDTDAEGTPAVPLASMPIDGSDSAVPQSNSTPVLITDRSERLRWTPELHACFVKAVETCGGALVAKPKEILEAMNVPGLSLPQCKSHLQKYRINIQTKMQREGRGDSPPEKRRKTEDGHMPPYTNQHLQPGVMQLASVPLPVPTSNAQGIATYPQAPLQSLPRPQLTVPPAGLPPPPPHVAAPSPQLADLSSDAAQKLQQALNMLVNETGSVVNQSLRGDPSGGGGPVVAPQSSTMTNHHNINPVPHTGNNFSAPVPITGGNPGFNHIDHHRHQLQPPSSVDINEIHASLASMGNWSTEQRQALIAALMIGPAAQLSQLLETALQQQMATAVGLYADLQKLLDQHHVVMQHMHQRLTQLIESTQQLQAQSVGSLVTRLVDPSTSGSGGGAPVFNTNAAAALRSFPPQQQPTAPVGDGSQHELDQQAAGDLLQLLQGLSQQMANINNGTNAGA